MASSVFSFSEARITVRMSQVPFARASSVAPAMACESFMYLDSFAIEAAKNSSDTYDITLNLMNIRKICFV